MSDDLTMKPRTFCITFDGTGVRNGWVEVTLAGGPSADMTLRPEQIAMNWAHNEFGRFSGCYDKSKFEADGDAKFYPLGCLGAETVFYDLPPKRRVFQ